MKFPLILLIVLTGDIIFVLSNKDVICPEVISIPYGSEGVLTSPGYPQHYPNSTECWTLLRAVNPSDISLMSNARILVMFEFIDMQVEKKNGSLKCFDKVELYDG